MYANNGVELGEKSNVAIIRINLGMSYDFDQHTCAGVSNCKKLKDTI